MEESIRFQPRAGSGGNPSREPAFGRAAAEKARAFHSSFPGYAPTPLYSLGTLAGALGVGAIHVKDESGRFGLNAFKSLGGSYAVGRYIADRLGVDIGTLGYDRLVSPEVRQALGECTFVTATDGNHGRGVAWTAKVLGQRAVVFMPKGSAPERLENIRALGAEASITEYNYDETVAYAAACAEKNGWVLVQDTSWECYETVPRRIMEGYTTMGSEIVEQLGGETPTHIFLQAGVGAMSGALAEFFADCYGGARPTVTIVEPNAADCIFRTAQANDGALRTVGGSLRTVMAGLACGVPCQLAWDALARYADGFASIPDYVAAEGMRILANPVGGDPRVISGESGAAAFGFAMELLRNDALAGIRDTLALGPASRLLFISTEGATDRENYRRIVWDGRLPVPTRTDA